MSTLETFNMLYDALSSVAPVTNGPPRFGRVQVARPSIAIRYFSTPRRNPFSIGDNSPVTQFNVFVIARNEKDLMEMTDSVRRVLDSVEDGLEWNGVRYEPVYGVEEEDYAFLFNVEV